MEATYSGQPLTALKGAIAFTAASGRSTYYLYANLAVLVMLAVLATLRWTLWVFSLSNSETFLTSCTLVFVT